MKNIQMETVHLLTNPNPKPPILLKPKTKEHNYSSLRQDEWNEGMDTSKNMHKKG